MTLTGRVGAVVAPARSGRLTASARPILAVAVTRLPAGIAAMVS
ncbi:hypothetical protein [Micromonospora sp. WMMD1082]|nr:hypothetical protein [Micromonospora sp. WMMD1082]MDG4796858.1 hypothetical protein [Micromonospora sp. WMMD1082]